MHPVGRDELQVGKRSKDGRPSAVSAHRQSDSQAALVGEPFRHHRYRRGVTKSVAQPADHPEANIQPVQAVRIRAQEEAEADQDAANERDLKRTVFVLRPFRLR